MAIHLLGNDVIFGMPLPFARFTDLAREHLRRYPDTPTLEARGERLRANQLPETDVSAFVAAVCKWGGYAGIGVRILKRNRAPELRHALSQAIAHLETSPPDFERALTTLNQLHSLGTPSFASKHLRFLRPDVCPVFDAVLRDALPYPFDPEGYAQFASDCLSLSPMLQVRQVENPRGRPYGAWFAADVEAALFVQVNEWL